MYYESMDHSHFFFFGLIEWEMICSHTPHIDNSHRNAHIHFDTKKLQ
jgi:hypothetical protein